MSQGPPLFSKPFGEAARVLVVCTGNICRSPAAALLLEQHQVFGAVAQIESAGLGAVVGAEIDPPMRAILDRVDGLDTSTHRARQITPQMIEDVDLIITMSTQQRSEVLTHAPNGMGKVFTLTELGHLVRIHGRSQSIADLHPLRGQLPASLPLDIADPYRRGDYAMQIAALDILRAISMLTGQPLAREVLAVVNPEPVDVMTSARAIDNRTGAYMVELVNTMAQQPGITYRPFNWRRALTGKVEVFHSHWPEAKLQANSWLKRLGRRWAFWLMTLNFKLRKTAVVQTMHNLAPHEEQSSRTERLLRAFRQRETLRISINAATPHDGSTPVETILHGHARAWLGEHATAEPDPHRLAYFGLIREYKGVPDLIRVFRDAPSDLRLAVAGDPQTSQLKQEIIDLADTDDRVSVQLGHISDANLVRLVSSSSIVILPYREMHNSGAAITALSLNRPVLVPRNSSTDALAAEVGEAWVIRYSGELTAEIIESALAQAQTTLQSNGPDLSLRDWPLAGEQHAAVFAEARLRARLGMFRGALNS